MAQLLALILVAVPLVLPARSNTATALVADAVGVIAVGWIVQRGLGLADPLAGFVDVMAASPERLALVLLAGVVVLVAERLNGRSATEDGRHEDDEVVVAPVLQTSTPAKQGRNSG